MSSRGRSKTNKQSPGKAGTFLIEKLELANHIMKENSFIDKMGGNSQTFDSETIKSNTNIWITRKEI